MSIFTILAILTFCVAILNIHFIERFTHNKIIIYYTTGILIVFMLFIIQIVALQKENKIYKQTSVNIAQTQKKEYSVLKTKKEIYLNGKRVCEALNIHRDYMQVGYIIRETYRIADKLGIDPIVLNAIIITESQYNPSVIGSFGEIGLMQIKLSTARLFNPELTKKDLFDWKINLYYGTLYLKDKVHRFGYIRGILAYNGGNGILKYKNKKGQYVNYSYYHSCKKHSKKFKKAYND